VGSEDAKFGRREQDRSGVRRLIADDDDLIARSRHLNLQAATYVGWKLQVLSNALRLPNYLIWNEHDGLSRLYAALLLMTLRCAVSVSLALATRELNTPRLPRISANPV
jgi:hypothetical protein